MAGNRSNEILERPNARKAIGMGERMTPKEENAVRTAIYVLIQLNVNNADRGEDAIPLLKEILAESQAKAKQEIAS